MVKRRGFTLIEIIVVLIIIGILAAVALPNYSKMKENALDKEASANLKLIMAAEKIYRMETGNCVATNMSNINQILKLSLPIGEKRNWDYATFCSDGVYAAQASRVGGDDRSWFMDPTNIEEPVQGTYASAGETGTESGSGTGSVGIPTTTKPIATETMAIPVEKETELTPSLPPYTLPKEPIIDSRGTTTLEPTPPSGGSGEDVNTSTTPAVEPRPKEPTSGSGRPTTTIEKR